MYAFILSRIAKQLHIDTSIVKTFLSIDFGSQIIAGNDLHTSEVELSMFLKALRKKLYYPYLHRLTYAKSHNEKAVVLKEIYSKYRSFYNLHQHFFANQNNISEIKKMLGSTLIFDTGIPKNRFDYLLAIVLKRLSPETIELIYLVNTLYRIEIAKQIQHECPYLLSVRGSLLFFNTRSFGIGYSANFSLIEKLDSNDKYDTASGSDLDLRVIDNTIPIHSLHYLENHVKKINRNHLAQGLSFIVETAIQKDTSTDDIIPINESHLLVETYFELMSCTRQKVVIENSYPSITSIKAIKRNYQDSKGNFLLTKSNIKKFVKLFKVVIQNSGANDEIVNHFSNHLEHLLIRGRMETDFYGYIGTKKLREAFSSLFLFSGYRFTKKDADTLFSQIINKL